MPENATKTDRFTAMLCEYDALIYKVCYMYAEDGDHLQDLRQEVAANLWSGFDSYSGKSKISTWIYRVALNTCITYFRRHGKHSANSRLDDSAYAIAADDDERAERLRYMYSLIGRLGKIDKAIVMLWLDEHSYDEISSVVGMSRANVASRLHRIRQRLAASAQE